MTTPIGPSSANPYGIGQSVGTDILSNLGISVQGGAVTSSSGGELGAGEQVYMGTRKGEKLIRDVDAQGRRQDTKMMGDIPDYLSVEDARNLPLIWSKDDPAKLRDFVNKGVIAKIRGFDTDMGMPEIMSAWDDMISASVGFTKSGQNWSPWDVMETYGNTKGKFGTERRGDFVYDVATGTAVKYVGPTSKTQTSRKVNLTSAEDVRAIAMQALREALGRAPTTEEVAQFRSSINALEKASPEVTTTTVQLKPNLATGDVEQTSSESTTSGGVSQAAMESVVQMGAQGTPEYAKHQSGTTYFNALLGLLGG